MSITREAFDLAAKITAACGHDAEHPPISWYGAPYLIQSWLARGWSAELIMSTVLDVLSRKRGGAPSNAKYFEPAIEAASQRGLNEVTLYSALDLALSQAKSDSERAYIHGVRDLAGRFLRSRINDPKTFIEAVISIFSQYPIEILHKACSPTIGLPSQSKFFPSIKEVRDFCEREYMPMRRQQTVAEQRARIEAQVAGTPRSERPTLDELRRKYGNNWGIGKR